MSSNDDLRPAEEAILTQFEARLGITRAALSSISDSLDAIEPIALRQVMAGEGDERQRTLIALLPPLDAALSGLAALDVLLTFIGALAGAEFADGPAAVPTDEEVADLFTGLDEFMASRPRFIAGPDGEVDEQ